MMLHGAWTYGSMKADGGDFVTGGHLGYMNFPPVDGGKGDPSNTVGNPGQYLLDLLQGHRRGEGGRQEVLRHRRCSSDAEVKEWIDAGSVPIVKGTDSQLAASARTRTS